MHQKTLIMLIVGIVVGFAAGYGVRHFQEKTPLALPKDHPPMNAPAPGSPAPQPDPQPDPRQQAQMEQLKREVELSLAEVKARPGDPAPLKKAGNLYYDQKEFQKAIEYYEQAARLDPKDTNLQVDLATSYWYLQQTDKAVEGLGAVLKSHPDHPQALYNMGIIMLHGRNDLKGAREYWARLVATKTETMDLQQIRQRLEVIDRMLAAQKTDGQPQPARPQPGGMPGK